MKISFFEFDKDFEKDLEEDRMKNIWRQQS
jgi:hypothetical protein